MVYRNAIRLYFCSGETTNLDHSTKHICGSIWNLTKSKKYVDFKFGQKFQNQILL